ARAQSVTAKNDALEQAVKSELTLEPDYDRDITDNIDASGCKSNDHLDQSMVCDSAIVTDMANDSKNRANMTTTIIAPPQEKELEEYLKDVADNNVHFINLSSGQQIATYKQLVQVQAPLGGQFTLYINNRAVSEEKIG